MTNPNEEQDWLDALAGRPNPNADPEVTRRATLLRQAIQHHDAALGVNDFDVEAGLQKLKFRMRREGLLEEEQHATLKILFLQLIAAATARLNKRIVKFAVALSVIFATLMMLLQPMLLVQTTATRGSDQQIVLAPDPEARLKQLTAELDRLGIKYQIERKEGKILLKAQGVDPVKDDVASFLKRNHITPPVGMDVELDIRSLAK